MPTPWSEYPLKRFAGIEVYRSTLSQARAAGRGLRPRPARRNCATRTELGAGLTFAAPLGVAATLAGAGVLAFIGAAATLALAGILSRATVFLNLGCG